MLQEILLFVGFVSLCIGVIVHVFLIQLNFGGRYWVCDDEYGLTGHYTKRANIIELIVWFVPISISIALLIVSI